MAGLNASKNFQKINFKSQLEKLFQERPSKN